jgi:transposase
MGGHRPMVLASERDWLLVRIVEQPDLMLRAIQAELADRGLVVSYDTVWRFYLGHGVTFKKACTPPGRIGRTWPAGGGGGGSSDQA